MTDREREIREALTDPYFGDRNMEDDMRWLLTELDAARENFRRYGWHRPTCGLEPCSCGFAAVRSPKEEA